MDGLCIREYDSLATPDNKAAMLAPVNGKLLSEKKKKLRGQCKKDGVKWTEGSY